MKKEAPQKKNKEKKKISLKYEQKLWEQGYRYIAGLDEAGRGPLAGPLVVAGVILPVKNFIINGLNDSKKLSFQKREILFNKILSFAISINVVIISEVLIDSINIYKATIFGMKWCIEQLTPTPEFALIDGMKIELKIPSLKIVKGDEISASIASASIIAKVIRDKIMEYYHLKFPEYHFKSHKGYPTILHKKALKNFGILPIHRKSYKPVKKYLK